MVKAHLEPSLSSKHEEEVPRQIGALHQCPVALLPLPAGQGAHSPAPALPLLRSALCSISVPACFAMTTATAAEQQPANVQRSAEGRT